MADSEETARARFRALDETSPEDWAAIAKAGEAFAARLPDRILAHMRLLAEDAGGFPVSRLEHARQAATRALRDGRDEEYVVCALLHDIGEALAPANHGEAAAAMLKPYVSERNCWMVRWHALFQGYYYYHHLGLDRDAREQLREHPDFDYAAEFARQYDQASFDPAYESLPLDAFEPMLRRVLAKPRRAAFARPSE